MTKEEAIKMAEARLQCLINETSGIAKYAAIRVRNANLIMLKEIWENKKSG